MADPGRVSSVPPQVRVARDRVDTDYFRSYIESADREEIVTLEHLAELDRVHGNKPTPSE